MGDALTKVTITNWQSLREVEVDLGRLTVITGPSSSGKTAFIRALRAVASNVRGTDVITRGASYTRITVHTWEHTQIALYREAAGGGSYTYTDAQGRVEQYTKLAGAVPEAITRALRIDPVPPGGASLQFAAQFDRPYLLDDSGAAVARTLGELTNVATIFAAVREANRRRAAAAALLKTRQDDLADLITQARAYAELPARLAACQRAQDIAEHAAAFTDRITRLRHASIGLSVAQGVLDRTVVPELPDDTVLIHAAQRLARFTSLTAALAGAQSAKVAAGQVVSTQTAQVLRLEGELHAALLAAGSCPTCGQAVTNT